MRIQFATALASKQLCYSLLCMHEIHGIHRRSQGILHAIVIHGFFVLLGFLVVLSTELTFHEVSFHGRLQSLNAKKRAKNDIPTFAAMVAGCCFLSVPTATTHMPTWQRVLPRRTGYENVPVVWDGWMDEWTWDTHDERR
jgi:hypothetical protein